MYKNSNNNNDDDDIGVEEVGWLILAERASETKGKIATINWVVISKRDGM